MPMILSWLAAPAAAATFALSMFLYAPDTPRSDLESVYPGDYLTVDGVRIRLRDTGPRDAPVLIMLHGFCASLDTWEPWSKLLSAQFRVIRFDLPGFGLTGSDPTGDYSDTRELTILSDLMDRMDVKRASLIGSSMGGRIGWKFAAAHADRIDRLVLVSPDGFASPGFAYDRAPDTPLVLRALPYLAPPRSLIKLGVAAAYAHPDALSEKTVTRYHDLLLAPGVRRALVARMGQTIQRNPAPTLARVKAPTLLLWGEKDGVIPIDAAPGYLQNLPQAKLVRLPNLGHLPFEEDPVGSLKPVQRFLSDLTP